MHKYQIIHPGPFLTIEDIRPYITKDEKCIFSTVPGTQGQLRINNNRNPLLVSKNGKRIVSVDFSRGTEVVIVNDGKHTFIMPKTQYDKSLNERNISFHGS